MGINKVTKCVSFFELNRTYKSKRRIIVTKKRLSPLNRYPCCRYLLPVQETRGVLSKDRYRVSSVLQYTRGDELPPSHCTSLHRTARPLTLTSGDTATAGAPLDGRILLFPLDTKN